MASATIKQKDSMNSDTQNSEGTPARIEQKPWTSTAGPIQTKKVEKVLDEMRRQHNCFKELTGIVGVSEHTFGYWSPFGGGYRNDVATAWNALHDKFGGVITRENYGQIVTEASASLVALVDATPIKDKRVTAEAEAARIAEISRREEERKAAEVQRKATEEAKRACFLGMYGQVGKEIDIPIGTKAIVLVLTYDDSDPMSDYFAPHCTVDKVLLAYTHGIESEREARNALARYPDLAALHFEWKSEKWSMGHGNYLIQKAAWDIGIAFPERPPGLPAKVNKVRWEVQFSSQRTYSPYRDYTEKVCTAGAGSVIPDSRGSNAVVKSRPDLNGVELWFDGRPDEHIISRLKANRWRCTPKGGWHWYTKDSPQARTLANEIAGVSDPQQPTKTTTTQPAVDQGAQDAALVQAQEDAFHDNQARTMEIQEDFNYVGSRHHY